MNKSTLNEDAKQDWLNIVKKHKKKQKGLPALSKLNTDAGNVEKNIELFNKMSSPVEAPSNNPISGLHGDSVEAAEGSSIGESLIKESSMNKKTIELYYPELEVTDVTTGKVFKGNYYEPDEYETTDVVISYEYEVDKSSVYEFLQELPELIAKYHLEDVSDETFEKFINTQFDELIEEFNEEILEYFEEDAADHARNNWDESYFEPDWDMMPGGHDDYRIEESKKDNSLDDSFDMSLRTLL